MGFIRTRGMPGFTLIELVITVAIIAILAAVAYPSYVSSLRKARREDAVAALLELQMAQEKHRANNPTYSANLSNVGFASATSHDGYYTLAITASSATAFSASATPKIGTAQAADTCTFIITQEGPDLSDATKKACWNK